MFKPVKNKINIRAWLDMDPINNGIMIYECFIAPEDYSLYTDGERVVAVDAKKEWGLFSGDWDGVDLPTGLFSANFGGSAAPPCLVDRLREGWRFKFESPCWVYSVPPRAVNLKKKYTLESLKASDAREVAKYWKLGDDPLPHIRNCIEKFPSACIRVDGELASWGGNHFVTDRAAELGFAHTKEEFRHRGYALRIAEALTARLYSMGLVPYCYVFKTNEASIALCEKLGWKRIGEATWFWAKKRK